MEQSPDQLVDALERRARRRSRMQMVIAEILVSAFLVTGREHAQLAFDEIHRADNLPHD